MDRITFSMRKFKIGDVITHYEAEEVLLLICGEDLIRGEYDVVILRTYASLQDRHAGVQDTLSIRESELFYAYAI
jgi:hypothetical protein